MADCIVWTYDAIAAKADGKPLSFIDRLIMLRSKPYIHDEFQFSERYDDVSFSATMQDKARCCRFKKIRYSHPQRWKQQVIPMTDKQEDRAYKKACELEDKKYDLLGLLSFGTRWRIIVPHRDRYWCAEAVATLVVAGRHSFDLIPDTLHPLALVERLEKILT